MNSGERPYGWVQDEILKAPKVAAELGIEWRAELGRPATDPQIAACESAISATLSPTHRAFLQSYDGAYFGPDLSHGEGFPHDVRILSCSEIIATTQRIRAFLEEFFSGIVADPPLTSAIVVARYGHSGDICLGDPDNAVDGEYVILDGFHETPDDWVRTVIAQSFREWLERMLASFVEERQLLYYWMPTKIEEIT